MPVYWCFQLERVAERVLYLEEMKETEEYWDVMAAIEAFRRQHPAIKPWEDMPV